MRYDHRLKLFIVFAIIILTMMCISLVLAFRTGEEATVGIFSLAATLIGTIFIAVELKNTQNVTCSDMLIDLNNYFHDSDRLMKVYEAMERCEAEGNRPEIWKDVRGVEIAQYCTFFENLYLLNRHHIADIEDLDDLFGYRFFLLMNNPYIQENYILPTSSSYVQIFRLYEVWSTHRRKINSGANGWERHVPGGDTVFPDEYLRRKLYLHDHGKSDGDGDSSFESRGERFDSVTLGFENLSEITAVQKEVVDSLAEASVYYPLSRMELLESLHMDRIFGIRDSAGRLVSFAVIVLNREGDRSLAASTGTEPSRTLTFDAVVTLPGSRGHGFQRHFIDRCTALARKRGAGTILATVAPDNAASKGNFEAAGFKVVADGIKYGGMRRQTMALEV